MKTFPSVKKSTFLIVLFFSLSVNLALADEGQKEIAADYREEGADALATGDLDMAQAFYLKSIELNPKSPVAYSRLGAIYRQKGEFEKAREAYSKAIRLDQGFSGAYFGLASLYESQGKHDEAIAALRRGIQFADVSDPDAMKAWDILFESGSLSPEEEEIYLASKNRENPGDPDCDLLDPKKEATAYYKEGESLSCAGKDLRSANKFANAYHLDRKNERLDQSTKFDKGLESSITKVLLSE